MLHITVERDGQAPQTVELAGPTVVVGRDAPAELRLKHEDGASRKHCQLIADGRVVYLEDLGSSNGTKLNDKRIDRRVPVRPGDTVTVGKVRLRVSLTAAKATASTPAVSKPAASAVVVSTAAKPAASQKPSKAAKPAATTKASARSVFAAASGASDATAAPAPASKRRAAEAPNVSASARVIVQPEPEPEQDAEAPATPAREPRAREPGTNDENEACRAEIDPLARRWCDLGRPPWALLHGAQLARGHRWMTSDRKLRPRPGELHREFIIASRRDRRGRVSRIGLGTGAIAVTLVASSLTAHAVYEDIVLGAFGSNSPGAAAERCSRDPALLEQSNALAAQASSQADPELALLIAARALLVAEGPCARYGEAEAVLRNQLARQRSRILGHQSVGFTNIDIARDDELIVTVDQSGTVKLWRNGGDAAASELPATEAKATIAALSPSDSTLVVGGEEGVIELWSVAQRNRPKLLRQLSGHRSTITALTYSDDGRWLATGDRNGVIRTWDMRGSEAGAYLGELREHRAPITHLFFRDGGQRLYSVGGSAYAWDLNDGKRKSKPGRLAMPGDVTAMVVDSVGQEVFTADQFGEVLRWRVNRGVARATSERIAKLEGAVVGLAFIAKDRALVAVGEDRQLVVAEIDKNMREDSMPLQIGLQGLPATPVHLAVDNAGRKAAVATEDGKIYIWNLTQRMTSASPIANFDDHTGPVRDLRTTRDGNWLLSASADGTLRQWDLQSTLTGSGAYAANDHDGAVFELALSGDGTRMLSGGHDKRLRAWRIDPSGDPRLQFSRELEAPIRALALSSDGRWAAVGVERQLQIFDLSVVVGDRDSAPIERSHHDEVVRRIAFSADRNWMVTADDAGVVNTWRLRSDGPEDTPTRSEATASPITALALAPTQPLVAVGNYDKQVRIWPLGGAAGAPIQQVAPHEGPVLGAVFSANSEYLVSGGEDSRAILRRNTNGRLEADPERSTFSHERRIRGLAFSPDRRWLATGSDDGIIRVWSMEASKNKQKDLLGHEGPIIALAFDASSELLISASGDNSVRLWRVDDLDMGGTVASMTLLGHSAPITTMRLDTAGRFVVSAGEDGAIRVWPLQHELLLRLACRVVGRDFSDEEWATLFAGQQLESVCERR